MKNKQIYLTIGDDDRHRLAEEAQSLGLGMASYSRLLIKIGHQRLYDSDGNVIAEALKDAKFL